MSPAQRSLLTTLHRSNLKLVVVVMATAWIAISVIAYINLRVYGDQSLKLVAQSIAYSCQAATVFHDAAAARETLGLIASQEGLVRAEIVLADGTSLGRVQPLPNGSLAVWLMQAGDVLFPQSSDAEIRVSSRLIGRVLVQGNSALYVEFFAKTLAAALLCMIAMAVAIASVSRDLERKVVGPLRALAALTHVVRLGRQFDRRAPRTDIAEINQLSEDFNALLAEIETLEKRRSEHAQKLQLANERLGHQIRHDGLTGLPNRGYFRECLAAQLERAAERGERIAVLYVDYDHFKSVNDQFGHAAGDELLVEAGRRIRTLMREGDVVARLGGDEFGVLLGPLGEECDAQSVAQQIVEAMHRPILIEGRQEIQSSVSVGIALYPDHAATLERLLSAADSAMYRAKSGNRNSFSMATSGEDIPPKPERPA